MVVKIVPEKVIQREILEWLNGQGYFFWRSNNAPVVGRSTDGSWRFRKMSKFTPKGVPDILGIVKGKFIGFEVKRQGRTNKRVDQEIFGARIQANGGYYFVVRSLQEVKEAFINVISGY